MFKHILVPLDQTELAYSLCDYALEMAQKTGSRITFLTISEDFGATSEGALQRTLSPENFSDRATQRAREVLSYSVDKAEEAGVESESILLIGDNPYSHIIDAANTNDYDILVMASHSRQGLEKLMIGSQTQKVLNQVSKPVLVIPFH